MSVLRPYQQKAVSCIVSEFESNQSTLLVIPTGGGKTEIFTEVVRLFQPKRTLVLVHREELVFQAKNRIEKNTGLKCSVEMADSRADTDLFGRADVVITTVQTQISGNGSKRFERFDPSSFGLVVVDECHHVTNKNSYNKVLDHYKKNESLKILGVTATPDRLDEEALGQMFQTVAFDYELFDAIKDGWLVPIEQQYVIVRGLDFSHVRLGIGDLNGHDLAMVLEQEEIVQGMVGSAIEIVGNKRTLVFTASVAQAEMASNIFNRHKKGIAEWISGETPTEIRRRRLLDFSNGATQVLINCAVLLEGYDNPAIESIVMLKPTTSRALFSQMIGRGTRALPGVLDGLDTPEQRRKAIANSAKPSVLIVDYVSNTGRHKLMSAADILGGNFSDAIVEAAAAEALATGRKTNAVEMLEKAQSEARKREEELKRIEDERKRKLEEELRKAKVVAKVDFIATPIDAFDILDITPCKERGWHKGKKLTQLQVDYLARRGIDGTSMPYHQAKQLIDELHMRDDGRLCTLEQAKKIKEMGKSPNVGSLEAAQITRIPACTAKQAGPLRRAGLDPLLFTVQSAKPVLDCLAKHNWKKSPELETILNANHTASESEPKASTTKPQRPLADGQKKFMIQRYYTKEQVDQMPLSEWVRIHSKIAANGFRPLPQNDSDSAKNWKPK